VTRKKLPPDLDGPTAPRPRDPSSGSSSSSTWNLSSLVRQWLSRESGDEDAVDELSPRYDIKELLGRGGMGDVHLARDRRLRRDVAIKTARLGHKENEAVGRFLHEAQVTAQLAHPNLPPLYDLGIGPDGTVFFTMRALSGRTLSQVLREDGPMPVGRALEVFGKVCDAVSYAHSRGVLHRDLKPGNVLVGEHGEVYVIDWGLARRLADDSAVRTDADDSGDAFTEVGAVVGTPGYMSPEQLAGDVALDVRADVYALGALLYALLAGRPPFVGSDPELRLKVHRGEYPPLGRVRKGLPWELERVVARALATRKEGRYRDADALHEDLRALVEGRPLPGIGYPLWRRASRVVARWSRPIAIAAAVIGGVGVVTLAAVGFHAVTVTRARDRALEAERETRLRSLDQDVALARLSARLGLTREARASLLGAVAGVRALGEEPRLAQIALGALDQSYPPPEVKVVWPGPIGATVLGDGDRIAFLRAGDAGTEVDEHDLLTGRRTHRFSVPPGREVVDARFVDGSLILHVLEPGRLIRTNATTGESSEPTPLPPMTAAASLRLTADLSRVALVDRDQTQILELPSGRRIGPVWDGVPDHLSTDGRTAIGHLPLPGAHRQVTHFQRWDLDTGVVVGPADEAGTGWQSADLTVSIVPDAAGIAVWSGGTSTRWTDVPSQPWVEQQDDRVVLVGIDGRLQERDLGTGALLSERRLGEGRVPGSNGFSVSDRWVGTSVNGAFHLWSRVAMPDRHPAHAQTPLSLDVSPDGALVATSTWSGEVAIWDWRARRVLARHQLSREGVRDTSFSPDGRRLATADREGHVVILDLVSGIAEPPLDAGRGLAMGVSWDGADRLWATYEDGSLVAWSLPDRAVARELRRDLKDAWNLEVVGGLAAVAGRAADDPVGEVWDLATGERRAVSSAVTTGYGAAVAPDGATFAFGTDRATVEVIDPAGERSLPLPGGGPVMSLAFSPDSRLVAAGTYSGRVFLIDVATGASMLDLDGHGDGVAELAFVPGTWTLLSLGGTLAELAVVDLGITERFDATALRLVPGEDTVASWATALERAELRQDWFHAWEAVRRGRAEGAAVAPSREARALQGVGDLAGAIRALRAGPDPDVSDGTREVWAASLERTLGAAGQ
jgi:WD40 repeat protein